MTPIVMKRWVGMVWIVGRGRVGEDRGGYKDRIVVRVGRVWDEVWIECEVEVWVKRG